MLLHARAISRSFAHRPLFTGVSLSIDEGDRIGLIGPNGAGKSTLLRILAGEDAPDDGQVIPARGLRAVYIPQQDVFPESEHPRAILTAAALAGPIHDHHEAEVIADMVLARIGFDDDRAHTPAGSLSGGWRKRLSIARGLAACGGEPDLLLLDEPTNHLDLDAIRWLEGLLSRQPAGAAAFASVFVTHDRAFLENIATRIIELNVAYPEGTLAADGDYTEFLRRKEEFLSGQARAQQALDNQVRRDLAWLARGPQARRTKSKSRIDSSYSRIDQLSDLQARNAAAATAGARVDFTGTGRRTRKLLAAHGISRSFGERTLFRELDVELGVGDCLGLLGPNGSGKTTLIRTLTGDLPPDAGEIRLSEPPPRIVVFSQHRRDFDPATPLREALSPGVDQVRFRGQPLHITAWSRRFLFRDEQLDQPVKSLSGGELARIHIARLMLEPADILVLDEPTNDLDIPTLETLEEALESFPGAIILITHDRAMLDRLATEILSFDGAGRADYFASLDQALAARAASAAPAAIKPGPSASAPISAPAAAPPARKKLTYNEQREYDAIEQRIAEAEARVAKAETVLADPATVADHTRMARACADLEEAQRAVATLYARWEELEAKRG